jgi:hypothetical protein
MSRNAKMWAVFEWLRREELISFRIACIKAFTKLNAILSCL